MGPCRFAPSNTLIAGTSRTATKVRDRYCAAAGLRTPSCAVDQHDAVRDGRQLPVGERRLLHRSRPELASGAAWERRRQIWIAAAAGGLSAASDMSRPLFGTSLPSRAQNRRRAGNNRRPKSATVETTGQLVLHDEGPGFMLRRAPKFRPGIQGGDFKYERICASSSARTLRAASA
jgi:hypothetical protein